MRIRIKFSKSEAMRYVGHLDLFRTWERTFRRSGLPLAYSLGFHPQPRLNIACALPLGFTSECEMIDAWLECNLPLPQIQAALKATLPPGLGIQEVEIIDDHEPAMQTQVMSATYTITLLDDIPDLNARVERIIHSTQLPRQRRGKTYDLRSLIENVIYIPVDDRGNSRIRIQLAAREGATGRPEEVLDELGIKFETTHIHREALIFCS